jgi:hypothetical protein
LSPRRFAALAAVLMVLAGPGSVRAQEPEPPAPVAPAEPPPEGADPAADETLAPTEGAGEEAPSEPAARDEAGPSEPAVSEEASPSEELPPALFGEEAAPAEAIEEEPAERGVQERDVLSSSPRALVGRRAAVWLELGGTGGGPSGGEVGALSAELGIRYRATDFLVADASFGLTYAATDVAGEIVLGGMPTPYAASIDRLEAGNPTLGGAFVHHDDAFLLEVGVSLSIPAAARQDLGRDAATAAQRASSEVALRAPLAMRGYRGAFRWAPERFGLAVPFRVVIPLAPLFVDVDGALAVLVPVLGDRGVDADTVIELGAGVGAEVAGPLRLGVRLAGVGVATGSLLPGFTLSVEPWMGLRFAPVHVTARGVLNLSGDDGLGGSRGPAFGVLVGAGVEI